jgi:hypothetical protein
VVPGGTSRASPFTRISMESGSASGTPMSNRGHGFRMIFDSLSGGVAPGAAHAGGPCPRRIP